MKTMAIRLDDELHAQLAVVAQLTETSITELIRTAITSHLETLRHDPALTAQADSVIAEIDRQATVQRDAITTLFADDGTKATTRRTRKTGE
jgi:predicted transcriptional regulator